MPKHGKRLGIKSREVDNPEFRLCHGSFLLPCTIVGNLESRFVPGVWAPAGTIVGNLEFRLRGPLCAKLEI